MKDWLQFGEHQKKEKKVSCYKVNRVYILPGVFSDASQDCTGVNEYKMCLNSFFLLFNNSYNKLKKFKNDLHNASVLKHRLCGKFSKHIKNRQKRYTDIHASLDNYFLDLLRKLSIMHHGFYANQLALDCKIQRPMIFFPSIIRQRPAILQVAIQVWVLCEGKRKGEYSSPKGLQSERV